MINDDLHKARGAIEALNAEFAWLIDHCDGVGVSNLFASDGIYDMSNRVFRGRIEIDGFYEARKARGRRAARHVFTNLHLVGGEDARRIRGTVVLTLYAHDGEPPYPSSPILVADYQDVYARTDDGIWLYCSRKIIPVFGGVPALVGQGNEQRHDNTSLTKK